MILVFGGAYQGKTDYALAAFGAETVCDVSEEGAPDFTRDIVKGIEGFAVRCIAEGRDPKEYFAARREEWADCILIVTDTSQGVVPIEEDVRRAREACGRLMIYLAEEADQVHRVFCGIGKRIK